MLFPYLQLKINRNGKEPNEILINKRTEASWPECQRLLINHVIISPGDVLLFHFRPETRSSGPSLPAHTKMKTHHSTGCLTSQAPARSLPVCTQPPSQKPPWLWMTGSAVICRMQTRVQIQTLLVKNTT